LRAITRELDRHDSGNPRPKARPTAVSNLPAAAADRRTVPVSVVVTGMLMVALVFCVMFFGF
jgi:hypothetical protein